VSGGSHAAGKPKDRGRIQSSPRRGPVPIIPGTPDEVVSEIASRLPLVMSGRVQRETVPADESAYPSTTGLVVHHELKVEAFEGGRIGRALWEGSLLASAVADEFAARGFEEVIGAWGTLVTADGRRRRVGGAVNRFGFRDQLFDSIPANLADTITTRAVERGLRDVHVSTVRGLQDAVVIEATTDTPSETAQKFAATRILDDLLDGPRTRFEGAFLGVIDAGGEPVLQTSTAARGVGGGFWVRPGLGVDTRGSMRRGPTRP
jgi:hypothetical protein